jgi:hypothetical protein
MALLEMLEVDGNGLEPGAHPTPADTNAIDPN